MYATTARLVVFALGVATVFVGVGGPYAHWLVLLGIVIAEAMQWKSDATKGHAETILRKLDLCQSFQIDLSPSDYRDIISATSTKRRRELSMAQLQGDYFTSTADDVPRRAVENLLESAWYTSRQCGRMIAVGTTAVISLILIAIAALVVSSQEIGDVESRSAVSRIVSSWLLLLFSLGLIRNLMAYSRFRQRCQTTIQTTEAMLGSAIAENDAIKQWYEYQIARANAPLLPEWLWRLMQASLNEAWEAYRTARESR